MSYKIAIVGATGKVGREIISILAERNFPIENIIAIASKESIGKEISFGEERILKSVGLDDYDFSNTDIAFFAAGREISRIYVPKAVEQNTIVIDNSSYFRMNDDVPLVIPEVNIEDLSNYKKRNIISNPNCSLIQLLVALKPLDDFAELKRVIVSSYQSTSGAGSSAMDELFIQTKSIYENRKIPPKELEKQIAFNVIPKIGEIESSGYTTEEEKIINEAKKIMGTALEVTATCVRVPVFVGHSLSVNAEFYENITAKDAKSIFRKTKHIQILDNNNYITPIEIVKEDSVFISRLRDDNSKENSLNMWVVSDNLRKGAALNAVQIAEKLIEKYL